MEGNLGEPSCRVVVAECETCEREEHERDQGDQDAEHRRLLAEKPRPAVGPP